MKSTKFLSVAAAAVLTFGMTSCKSDTKEAQDEVVEATEDQAEATAEYENAKAADTSDYAVMKAGTKKLIADNDKRIAELREKATKESAENKVKFNAQIDKLEAKNDQLEKDLDEFSDKAGEKWDAFKARVEKSANDVKTDIDDYKREHNYD
ncbi:hypothetical protein [Flavobacterium sp.]|uniref:hypothetical protein n=1 Tax=Flavobacterium sp. TaxID=239 RepID=UPI0012087698|nr:hypothetical protein [Flavobacterium sp.]RZJ69076.1 MAG: hypothetical protein EOO49_18700 [Flavobacterium sp.]